MALLTTQMTLIRTRRVALHKKLGLAGLFLILAMAILGPWAAFVIDHRHLGTPDSDPPFLILQLGISILLYDRLTRGRFNRATTVAIPVAIAIELAICVIYYLPGWGPVAKAWIS